MLLAALNWTAVSAITSGAVALGTFVLAAVTVRLARSTGRSVEVAEKELVAVTDQAVATNAQVELSARAMKASQQPMLVPVIDGPIRNDLTFIARGGERTTLQIGPNAMCWQTGEGQTSVVWAVIPLRNIGSGLALIPTDDNAVIAQISLFGGFTGFGRPSQRAIAPDDVFYLVFCESSKASPAFTLALGPDETGASGIVSVRYWDASQSTFSQTRIAFRHYVAPEFSDAVVTITEILPGLS